MLGDMSQPGSRFTHRNCNESKQLGGLELLPVEASLQPGRGAVSTVLGKSVGPLLSAAQPGQVVE